MNDHQWRNRRVRGREREKIMGLKEFGIPVRWITPYQARIFDVLDLYPTHQRYHNIKTGERGGYASLASIVLKEVPAAHKQINTEARG